MDFAIFKPHGNRQFKLNRLEAQVFINGELKTRALTGPSNFEAWMSCWEVFRAACLCIEELSPSTLDAYAKGISMLNDLYPRHWGVVYCADEIMRAEIWNRLAEELEDKSMWPAALPWDYVIQLSTYGGGGTNFEMLQWWQSHVVLPCQNQTSPINFIQRLEGTELLPSPHGWAASAHRSAPRSDSAPPNKRKRNGTRGGNRGGGGGHSGRAGQLGAPDYGPPQHHHDNNKGKGGKNKGKGKGNDKGKGHKGSKGSNK